MEPGKLTLLQIENVGIIRTMSLDLDKMGNLVRIEGPNASGKSWALNSILYALARANYVPDNIIRDKEAFAKIVLETKNGYRIEKEITKGPDGKQSERLKVSRDGMTIGSARAFLDSISSQFLDPSVLMEARGEEVYRQASAFFNVSDLDEKIAKSKEAAAAARAAIKALGKIEPPDAPRVECDDITSARQELAALETASLKKKKFQTDLADMVAKASRLKDDGARINAEIVELQRRLEEKEAEYRVVSASYDQAVKDLDAFSKTDPGTPDKARMEELSLVIANFADSARINAAWDSYEEKKAIADEQNAILAKCNENEAAIAKEKADRMSSVGNITFEGNTVAIAGREWGLCSTAERLCAAIELAVSSFREGALRVLYIHRGESIGKELRAQIAKIAIEKDVQIFMEVMNESAALPEDGVVHIFDGEVLEPEYREIKHNQHRAPIAETTASVEKVAAPKEFDLF